MVRRVLGYLAKRMAKAKAPRKSATTAIPAGKILSRKHMRPVLTEGVHADDLPRLIDATPDEASPGLAYDRVSVLRGESYRDSSTVVIVPSRDPMFHHQVITSWQNLIAPMNQKRMWMFVINDEVGTAYTNAIKQILAHPELSKWRYVLTLESDNINPPDAHIRLLETIEAGRFDGVSGLYWTKGEINQPMAYGDPAEYARTGVLDFKPRDIRAALERGHVMPVNGIAMGCSLYRMDLFRQIEPPWFVTVADIVDGAAQGFTQDLFFAKRAKEAGKSFAVDMRVKGAHLDLATGQAY